MVARDGIELQGVVITRKLLILRSARRAKKATLPDRRYKIGTKIHSQSNHFFKRQHENTRRPSNAATELIISIVIGYVSLRGRHGGWRLCLFCERHCEFRAQSMPLALSLPSFITLMFEFLAHVL